MGNGLKTCLKAIVNEAVAGAILLGVQWHPLSPLSARPLSFRLTYVKVKRPAPTQGNGMAALTMLDLPYGREGEPRR